ncbi:diguanylate cyclase [Pseudomonas putida]|nr:diguanylate cyclase [Pseudomonas putida]
MWERACPAITGAAGAMLRGVLFAGKPAPTGDLSRCRVIT